MAQSIYSRILLRAALLRGSFINNTSRIEKLMEQYTAYYFCQNEDRMLEMIEFLTGDRFVSFESKRVAFETIMKKHFTSIHKANSKNFENLTTIQTQRNRLAHLIVCTDSDAIKRFEIDTTIGFAKYSGTTKIIWYSPTEYDRILNISDETWLWMADLILSL